MWRSLTVVAVLFAALQQHAESASQNDPVAHCSFGALRGTVMKSRSGRDFYAYRGIRYGRAARFEPPVANTDTWQGIRDAVEDGAACPQASDMLKWPTSEDCLFLNVYTPKLLTGGTTKDKLPVIIHIHYGAFAIASGQSSLWGHITSWTRMSSWFPSILDWLYLVGFLSTGDSVVPGNMGLKDQVLAMQWVQAFIECFGGDKNSVTLLGYSSGGASVNLHMASKLSQHLFHRGISMGGTASCSWAFQRDQKDTLRRLAKNLNCPHDVTATSQQIVDCLKKKDVQELAMSDGGLRRWNVDPLVPLPPVLEPKGSSDYPFLTEDPECIFRSGNFVSKPWITGTTSNDVMNIAATIVQNETLVQEFRDYFSAILPIAFSYEEGGITSAKKTEVLKNFYFPYGCITKDSLQCVTDIYTDGLFWSCADHSVKIISAKNKQPTYYYHFSYLGKYTEMTPLPGYCKKDGPVHHDDLTLLFYRKDYSPLLNDSSLDTINSKKLVELVYNFALTGNPTPSGLSTGDLLGGFVWEPYTLKFERLDFGYTLQMKQGYGQERATIWDQIYCRDNNHPTCAGPALKYQCNSQ